MKVKLTAVLLVTLLAAATAFAAPPSRVGAVLASELSADRASYSLADDIAIRVTITNRGGEPASLLRWQTPIDGIEANIFEVTRDGEPVPYVGRLYKRAMPGPDDFVTILPGDAMETVIDLSSAYDMSQTGQYSVRYSIGVQALPEALAAPGEAALVPVLMPLASNALSMWIEGREDGLDPEPMVSTMAIGGYTNCTNTQQTTLSSAHSYARTMGSRAYSYLTTYGNSTRYRWWFGTYTTTRFNKVKSNFYKVKDAFDNKTVRYDCGCTQSAYAYVYPNSPYKIYLCKAFWSAPYTGRDSKAGTLIHEMTHFYVVASTQDYVYGATGAHNLALSSPDKAVANADNHEYFAEDSY